MEFLVVTFFDSSNSILGPYTDKAIRAWLNSNNPGRKIKTTGKWTEADCQAYVNYIKNNSECADSSNNVNIQRPVTTQKNSENYLQQSNINSEFIFLVR